MKQIAQVCQAVKKLGALAISLVPLSETGCRLSDSQALDFSCFTIWCDATMLTEAIQPGSKKIISNFYAARSVTELAEK